MSDMKQCDGCEQYFDPREPHFVLGHGGADVTRFGEGPWQDKHFHGVRCLARWCDRQHDAEVQG